MSTDIGVVRGVIELQDEFTGTLGLAEAALHQFSAENQESLKAVAEAGGLVVAAFTAIGAAAIELGTKGAQVQNVENTLEHFTGSAQAAANVMDALRKGTLNTVGDFELASTAAHLLSAGVKLTAEQFGTLGEAAEVMHKRGLGPTAEQLELVSNAMVTGRTRALALKLGVVDVTDSEDRYAASLGITKDQLSDAGKAEAKRQAILELLTRASKDAGAQERDFGEQIQAAKVFLENWIDEIGKAVAASPVLSAGMKAIGAAVSDAFGGDKKASIETVVGIINHAAIIVVDFGIATVEAARVVNVAWSSVKTIILAVETAVVGVADGIAEALAVAAEAGAKLHLVPPDAVAEVEDARTVLRGMTGDLAAQTAEAAKGIVGHSEFDKTLDKLGGTLFTVRDAMEKASKATKESGDTDEIAAKNAHVLAQAQEELNAKMIDQAKLTAALTKSTKELDGIWNDYFVAVAQHSQTSEEAMREQIEQTFNKQVEALDALDPLYDAKYKAYRATADENLSAIGSKWNELSKQSRESLQEQADAALEDYNRMAYGALTFSKDALDTQLQKYKDLTAEVMQYGQQSVVAYDEAAAAAAKQAQAQEKIEAALKAEQETRRQMGGSKDVTSVNFEDQIAEFNHLQQFVGANQIDYGAAYKLAKQGYSFADIIGILNGTIKNPGPPAGPRIPGFAEGGTVMVGENGPEAVRLPFGSQVFPTGVNPNGGGVVNMVFHVNGTAQDVAKKVSDVIMQQLKLHRQFGTA